MPRRYYRRTRVIRPKKKWASGIKTINFNISPESETPELRVPYTGLVINASQTSNPTPVILKAGNFKVNADVYVTLPQGGTNIHLVAFIVFLPEGIAPADNQQFGNLITSHPEYIMAWKQIDAEYAKVTDTAGQINTQRVAFSSRLKEILTQAILSYLVYLINLLV